MAAEHRHPSLLGNRGGHRHGNTCRARSEVLLLRGMRPPLMSMSPIRHWRTLFRPLTFGGSRVCPGWLIALRPTRIGERKHESQQHLPQQRARLLADGASDTGRARQALLAHVGAILAAPRRACGARRRRIENARAPRRLRHALIISRSVPIVRKRQIVSAFTQYCALAFAPQVTAANEHVRVSPPWLPML